MKLIIDIPDEAYNMLLTEQFLSSHIDVEWLLIHGRPLPKGHGRLIDADALVKKGDIAKDYLNIFAPTIIEADKAESEDI